MKLDFTAAAVNAVSKAVGGNLFDGPFTFSNRLSPLGHGRLTVMKFRAPKAWGSFPDLGNLGRPSKGTMLPKTVEPYLVGFGITNYVFQLPLPSVRCRWIVQ